MFKNKLIVMSIITVCAIIAASIFVQLRAPQTEKEKEPFFPELSEKIESVNHISIKGYANSINLSRIDNEWVIEEFDNYPALPDKVKSAVLGAVDLKTNAEKTALPRLYHRLGVEGPEVEDTTSLLFTLKDTDNKELVNVIVGKPRRSSAAQSTPGLYVRKPDEATSYLVDGVIDISAIKTDWIERTLFDIPAEAIKSIRIDHFDGDTFTLLKEERGQEQFLLQNIPLGKKQASDLIIKRFGSILQDMQINGARSQEKFEIKGNLIQAQIVTFEGIIANINCFLYEDVPYASFEFRYDETIIEEDKDKTDDVKAFIGNLNARTLNWWFEIPEFKYDLLKKRSNIVMRNSGNSLLEDE